MTSCAMAEYVVYVNVDRMRMATELSVTTTLSRCGFKRAMRRDEPVPLATLLFQGNSSYDELQLTRHLERVLRYDTMCDVDVIVFQLAKLRSRSAHLANLVQAPHKLQLTKEASEEPRLALSSPRQMPQTSSSS